MAKQLTLKVSIRKRVALMLLPLWLLQTRLGRRPWVPRWAIKIEGPF